MEGENRFIQPLRAESNVSSRRPVGESDYIQLCRLVIEHAWRVDGGNADTVHELHVPHGTLTIGEEVLKGTEEIRKWGQEVVENHTFDRIRHICGNMRFFETGKDTAEGVTVLAVYFDKESKPPGTSVPWTVGEDQYQYVRTEKG